jgi:hypothetical protein
MGDRCRFFICCLVAAPLLLGCDALFSKPPPSAINPPIYPKAEHVEVIDKGNRTKLITFETAATWEEVEAFYNKILTSERWVNPFMDQTYPENVFEWHQSGPDGPTHLAYRLVFNYGSGSDGALHVSLEVIRFDPLQERLPDITPTPIQTE